MNRNIWMICNMDNLDNLELRLFNSQYVILDLESKLLYEYNKKLSELNEKINNLNYICNTYEELFDEYYKQIKILEDYLCEIKDLVVIK